MLEAYLLYVTELEIFCVLPHLIIFILIYTMLVVWDHLKCKGLWELFVPTTFFYIATSTLKTLP